MQREILTVVESIVVKVCLTSLFHSHYGTKMYREPKAKLDFA
jgi:hypothetical protein